MSHVSALISPEMVYNYSLTNLRYMEMERHLKQPVHEERAVRSYVGSVADDLLLRVDPLRLAVAEVPHELGEVDECLVVHGVYALDAGRQGHGRHDRLWIRQVPQYILSQLASNNCLVLTWFRGK